MPDPNPSERLAAIEARVEAATAGPWFAQRFGFDADGRERWKVDQERGGYPFAVLAGVRAETDAALIAHAREDIPWLLEDNKKLREALEFYADRAHWSWDEKFLGVYATEDCGMVARQALADSGEASGEAE